MPHNAAGYNAFASESCSWPL